MRDDSPGQRGKGRVRVVPLQPIAHGGHVRRAVPGAVPVPDPGADLLGQRVPVAPAGVLLVRDLAITLRTRAAVAHDSSPMIFRTVALTGAGICAAATRSRMRLRSTLTASSVVSRSTACSSSS